MKSSSIMKWGKVITYSVSRDESWMVVSEGRWKWIYVTSPGIQSKELRELSKGIKPDFVNRKGMNTLLMHFGISKDEIKKLFEKEKYDTIDV